MVRYVQLELSKGITPEGERVVSEANLVERPAKGVQVGPGTWSGMGLFQRDAWGIPVVTHGGPLPRSHSKWYALPEAGVGTRILPKAYTGAGKLGPFPRRLAGYIYEDQHHAGR